MRKLATVFFVGIVAVLNSGISAAQSTGSVQGTVRTSDGEPAASVFVSIKGSNKRVTTKKDGTYLLSNIREGEHTIRAMRVGLEPREQKVTVVAGKTTTLDLTLASADYQLEGVTVSANKSPNERPVTIGKVAIAPMDLPQAVATIDEGIIKQQQVLHLSDALKNVNGVYQMGGTGGTQEEVAARGFALGSSNTFKNGVRFNNSAMPEMSSLERLEVLKGSSAILFGNVAAGGVINLVTKKPQFYSGGQVAMRVGSYGMYKPSMDVYGPLLNSQVAAYRIDATYEKANSFRDNVGSERVYINPSFLVKAGSNTDVLLEGDYLKDDRTNDYGTGAVNYTIANVPRNQFLGASWSYFHANQGSATATITHRLADNLQIRAVGGYQNYQSDLFTTTRPNAGGGTVQADGTWVRGVQRSGVDEKYYIGQIDFNARLTTGFLSHNLLVGVDADKYNTRTTAYDGLTKYDTVNIFDLTRYKQRTDIPAVNARTLTTAPVSRAGVYVQDLIAIADQIKLLAGARWSYQQTKSDVLTYADNKMTSASSYDDAITPRFGLIYQPMTSMAIFASYSNSFTLNTGVDVNGNALPPSFLDQYEVGIKNDLFDGMLSANLTVYQIVNSNMAQTSLANGNTNSSIKELAGEVTSKGLELDVMTRPYNGFSLIGGYSYNQTKYTKSNTYIEGSELRYNPHHTANMSVNYDFDADNWLNGLSAGATLAYIGDRVAGRSTRLTVQNDVYRLMPVPAYTQVDLSLGYQFDNLALRFKVANLFDELSYYVHDDNSVNPIAPRTFSLTTSMGL